MPTQNRKISKIYLIAGEASGDLHGSNLVKALLELKPDLQLRCWGGDLMEKAGATLVKHYRDLAFMGFIEVVMNLRTILRNIRFCKEDIAQFQPDAIVLIDYPGFNMRIAEWAHQKGIPVYYYISPQIWAWKQNRVKKIRAFVTRMFVVLPFEKSFYKKFGVDVDFVGHPLLDVVPQHKNTNQFHEFCSRNELEQKPIIALLPGSRKQEISVMLPLMLSVIGDFKNYQFVVAGAPGQSESYYRQFLPDTGVYIVFNQTYDLLGSASAGLITSGTATLEAALFRLPQVVCYKANPVSYAIAKQVIKVKYISLVNLVLDKPVVTELIQHELNHDRLVSELSKLLEDQQTRDKIARDYDELHQLLGGSGASANVARLMLKNP